MQQQEQSYGNGGYPPPLHHYDGSGAYPPGIENGDGDGDGDGDGMVIVRIRIIVLLGDLLVCMDDWIFLCPLL